MEFNLREWNMGDVDSLVNHANNCNIASFLTDGFPHPYTKEDAERFITSSINIVPPTILAVEINGEAAGSIGIYLQQDVHRKNAELGYWLSEKYWGNGIMTEVVIQMTNYVFDNFEITRIFARPFGNNAASQRILQKAGYTLEAVFADALYKNGQFIDEYIYAIRRK